MSLGSDSSGEDFVAGRDNRAEGSTKILVDVPPGESNFNGPAILVVEVAQNLDNSEWDRSEYEAPDTFTPSNQIHGLIATASSGGGVSNPGGDPGGTGVIGTGGLNQGTGVQGLGGGATLDPQKSGDGGIGVHGLGGSRSESFVTFHPASTTPGAGLVGQGGRQSAALNTTQLPHAAGVIGIGGGIGPGVDALPSHTLMDTGGAGVYGQGAELSTEMVFPVQTEGQPAPTAMVPSGPLAPGIGVIGRGGTAVAPASGIGAGVVGLAGGVPSSAAVGTSDGVGVFGQGNLGVRGIGSLIGVEGFSSASTGVLGGTDVGTGVYGSATKRGRGGVFVSNESAQLQLIPHSVTVNAPDSRASSPSELSGTGIPMALPKAGLGGDLLAVDSLTKAAEDTPELHTCTLWFCVRSNDEKTGAPAVWSQVLMGTLVPGQT